MKLSRILITLLVSAEFSAVAGSGGSFVKTTKSYRPSDLDQVGTLNVREKKAVA